MMLVSSDRAQRASDWSALLLTSGLVYMTLIVRPFSWQAVQSARTAVDQAVELTLESAPEPTPAPPPPALRPLPKRHEIVTAAAPMPADPVPLTDDPIPEDAAVVAAAAAVQSQASPPVAANADLEAQYAQALREDIDRRTRLPDSPQYRLHRVSGEVRVRFVVTRGGEAREVQVARSSGSSILDQTALAIVSAGHYAPMPAAIFVNQAEHLFAVTIAFNAAVQAARAH
jgi:TonB family protein